MNATSDFLIVGAGSAGCIVARVLAEAGYRVRLLEAAGPAPPRRRPAEYLQTFETAEDGGLRTLAQSELAGRQLHWPRGRGPGGSTRINAMIWYPPRAGDLRMLHAHGGDGWAPELLAESLRRVTAWVRPQAPRWLSPAAERFLQTARPAVEPPAAFARMNGQQGRRTAADVLEESTARAGCVELVPAAVDRVLFDADRAIGVQGRCEGHSAVTQWLARRGVILCSGSIASPLILMRSGIGPADVLAQAGIAPRCEAGDVGQHLADHLIMPVVFSLRRGHRFPAAFSPGDLARWQVAKTGPVASNLAEAGAIYPLPQTHSGGNDGGDHGGSGELQVHVTPTHYLLHPARQAPAAMTIGVNLCRPKSRGRITLRSADPAAPPQVDPAYLSDPQDAELLVAAVSVARRLAADPALERFVVDEKIPGAARLSPEATLKAIRRFSQTLYHPTGTCRLGSDPGSVVDPQCRVRGCRSLYVIDASVLPEIPSVNPNAAVMMLAYHAAWRLQSRGGDAASTAPRSAERLA